MGFVTVQIIRKLLFILISLAFQTFNSQPSPVLIPPSKSKLKTQDLFTSNKLKNHCFFSCINILIVRHFQRKPFSFSFFSVFKLIFPQNYRFYRFDQDWHRKHSTLKNFFYRKTVVLCCLHQCLDSAKFPRSATLFRSIFKLAFLSHCRFEFFHHELSPKHNTGRKVMMWKTMDFDCCIRVLW